jgi:hypothetical protein
VNYLQRVAASAARTTPAAAPPPSPAQQLIAPPGEPLAPGPLAFEDVEHVRGDTRAGDGSDETDVVRASRADSLLAPEAGARPAIAPTLGPQRESRDEPPAAPVPPRLPVLRRLGAAPAERIVAPRGLRTSRPAAPQPGAASLPEPSASAPERPPIARFARSAIDARSSRESTPAQPERPAAVPSPRANAMPPAGTNVPAETTPPLAHDARPADVPLPAIPAPPAAAGTSPADAAPAARDAGAVIAPSAHDASPPAVVSALHPLPRAPAPTPLPAVQQREPERPALSIGRVEVVVENEFPSGASAPVYARPASARPASPAASPVLERFRLRA